MSEQQYPEWCRMDEAIRGIADDYMTSEVHHPGYVLIPTERFEKLAALPGARSEVGVRHWEEIIGDMTDAGVLPADDAASTCDSDRCLAVFGAPEWSELSGDGKQWVTTLIQEAVVRLHKQEVKYRG